LAITLNTWKNSCFSTFYHNFTHTFMWRTLY